MRPFAPLRYPNASSFVPCGAAAGERAGCLVGFHSQSSIDSRHYSVWLSKANHTYRTGLRATHFAVLDDGGDHVCFTARVLSAQTPGPFTPLRASDADDLEPGHPAEARAVSP